MSDNTTTATVETVETVEVEGWTAEDVEAIERDIRANLSGAATLLILGVEAEFYKLTNDKDAAAWLARVLDGSGFQFDRRTLKGEMSARNKAIRALIKSGATVADIARTLGIGVATVQRVKEANGLVSVGGTKVHAATTEPEAPATVEESTTPDAPATVEESTTVEEKTEKTGEKTEKKTVTVLERAGNAVEAIAKVDDKAQQLNMFALLVAQIQELAGVSAAELAEKGAALLAASK